MMDFLVVRPWSYSMCVRILMFMTLFIFTALAASSASNVTLEISSQIPDDFDSPLLVNLMCKIPADDKDNIKNPMGICLGTRKGNVYTRLASINVFNQECLAYDKGNLSQANGEISEHSGFLSATLWVKRGEPEVDEYTCTTNFIDTKSRPNTMTISERSRKIGFYTLMANEFSDVRSWLMEEQSRVNSKIDSVEAKVFRVNAKIDSVQANFTEILQRPTSCSALRHGGHVTSARQRVTWPDGTQVLCDTESDGGGWTIFQRRVDGQIGFYRGWNEYENGFGDLNSDFWLGLRQLNHLMYQGPQELRVDLKYKGRSYYARYSFFHVDDFRSNYILRVKGHSGNATDELKRHDGFPFSTYDRDNDSTGQNCAKDYTGAWWYKDCHDSNLNGLWVSKEYGKGVNWRGVNNHRDSASFTEMKSRPIF